MSDRNDKPNARLAQTEYILTGRPYRTIVKLAWPAIVSMMAHTVLTITDAAWVGRLGAAPMAAVISSMFVIWIVWSLSEVITSGAVALVSRKLGAKNTTDAGYIADHVFRLSIWFSLALTALGLAFSPWAFEIMDSAPEVKNIGIGYLRIFFLAGPMLIGWELFSALYRAAGDTKTPFIIAVSSNVLNIGLDPLLIFGIGPFPEMGAKGAAVATLISYTLAMAAYFIAFRRRPLPFDFCRRYFARPDWHIVRRAVKIGLPISMSGIVFSIVYLFVNRVTASFGTEAVAALGVGNRIESLNFLIAFGFSMAVATLVGQNLGAKNPQRAQSLTFKTVWLISGFCGITSVLFFIFALPIAKFFNADPAVWPYCVSYLQILALSQVLMGWEIVFEGAFAGAGDTLPPMIVSIVGSVARVPLAYALALWLGWGVAGIWWTITLTTIVKAFVLYFWFRTGRWKNKEV
ncbi:MATE family efflux transporter [Candidatus Zixiibacteriota bacterium]